MFNPRTQVEKGDISVSMTLHLAVSVKIAQVTHIYDSISQRGKAQGPHFWHL